MLTISSVPVSSVPQQAPTVKAEPALPVKASKTVSPENAGVSVVVSQGGDAARAEPVYAPTAFPPVNPTGEAARLTVQNNAAVPERVAEVAASAVAAVAVGRALRAQAGPDGAETVAGRATAPEEAQAESEVQAEETPGGRRADNVRQARAQARAEVERFKGQFPKEVKSAVQEALDTQINELLPNMWKASRAAVDVLIGEEARAASAARAEAFAPASDVPSERAVEATETYLRTGTDGELPAPGSQVDQRV